MNTPHIRTRTQRTHATHNTRVPHVTYAHTHMNSEFMSWAKQHIDHLHAKYGMKSNTSPIPGLITVVATTNTTTIDHVNLQHATIDDVGSLDTDFMEEKGLAASASEMGTKSSRSSIILPLSPHFSSFSLSLIDQVEVCMPSLEESSAVGEWYVIILSFHLTLSAHKCIREAAYSKISFVTPSVRVSYARE
jgi:hypothetical protein